MLYSNKTLWKSEKNSKN